MSEPGNKGKFSGGNGKETCLVPESELKSVHKNKSVSQEANNGMAAPKATTLNSQYVTAFSVHEPAKISPTHRVKSPLSLRTVLLPGRQVLRSQDHPWRLLSRLLCLFLFLLSGRQCSSISLHLYQSLRWERLGFSGCQHPFLPHLLEAQVSLPSWLWTPHCHIMSRLCATCTAS